jgi:hypothetical protein
MPVPTEQLAGDIRELDQRLSGRLESQEQAFAEMRGEFREMREEFTKFRARINTILAISSAVALVVLGSAGMLISGAFSLQRELGKMEANVSNQSMTIERLDMRFDDIRLLGEKLNHVAEDLSRLHGRLDRNGKDGVR